MNNTNEISRSSGSNSVMSGAPASEVAIGAAYLIVVGRTKYDAIFDSLLSNSARLRLLSAADYRELWAIPHNISPRLTVLYDTLHSFELEASCRLIRRRWPAARILVIRSKIEKLEKSLYDFHLSPSVPASALLTSIRKYSAGRLFKITSSLRL
jgi:hypothetical protein